MLTHEYKVIEEDYISRFQEAINEAAQEGYTLQSYQHTAHHDEDRPTMLAFTWTAIMSRSVAGTEYSPDKRIEDIADVRGITPQELISEALDTPEPAPGDFRFTFEPGRASGRRKGWAKRCTSVNRKEKYGHAIIGDWLPENEQVDLAIGSVIVEGAPEGSVKNQLITYRVGRVEWDGIVWYENPDAKFDWKAQWYTHKEFQDFLDVVERMIANE